VEVRQVTFRGAALREPDRPREWFPHVAVAGRSNVGKSSLLNWLFRQPLARVAKAPGKTRTLNFYLVNGSLYVVDLPGYGYAKVARQLREEWGRALASYLLGDERVAGVVTLVDIRHGPTALDLQLQELLDEAERDRVVVLTKADKVGRGQRSKMQREVQQQLGLAVPPLAVSVNTGEGRRELLREIDRLAAAWRDTHQRGD
jgi:GTP-binding protein